MLPSLTWKFQNSSEHNSTCQRIIFWVGFGNFVDLLSVERASAWLLSQPVSLSITLLNGGLNLSCLNATSRSYFPRTQPGHWQTYFIKSALISKKNHGITYAAVAAKFSTRFASVTKLKQTLNIAVKAHTAPNLAVMFRTNARTTIAAMGINEETSVPRIVAMRWKCVSR